MLKMHGTTARQKYNLISKSDDKLLQYVTLSLCWTLSVLRLLDLCEMS